MPDEDSTTADVCARCEGELFTIERSLGRDNDEVIHESACRRCLSVPVDDVLRAFAREWLGDDPWKSARTLEGWHVPGRGDWSDYGVPLYLPAGMDLGLRWLAHLVGLRCGLAAPGWEEADDMGTWELAGSPGGIQFAPEADGMACVVPVLDAIPADAPLRLRAARALKLCIEAAP